MDGTADFSGSAFAIVPDFRDAKLDRPPEVARMAIAPSPLNARRFGFFATINGEENVSEDARYWSRADDVARFRKLKAMALAANDHEKDGDFFALEMRAKRGVETTTFWGLLFNTLYGSLSNYGQSFTRPLAAMGALFAAFAALYIMLVEFAVELPGIAERWTLALFAAELSARSTVPLLGTAFRFAQKPKDAEGRFLTTYGALVEGGAPLDWLVFLSVLQNLIGLVLLFLLLLALRNKFRLK